MLNCARFGIGKIFSYPATQLPARTFFHFPSYIPVPRLENLRFKLSSHLRISLHIPDDQYINVGGTRFNKYLISKHSTRKSHIYYKYPYVMNFMYWPLFDITYVKFNIGLKTFYLPNENIPRPRMLKSKFLTTSSMHFTQDEIKKQCPLYETSFESRLQPFDLGKILPDAKLKMDDYFGYARINKYLVFYICITEPSSFWRDQYNIAVSYIPLDELYYNTYNIYDKNIIIPSKDYPSYETRNISARTREETRQIMDYIWSECPNASV